MDADDGQNRRQRGESHRQERQHPLVRHPCVDLLVERPQLGDDDVGIDAPDLTGKKPHHLPLVAGDADVDADAQDPLQQGIEIEERLRRNLATNIVIPRVAEDADDLDVGLRLRPLPDTGPIGDVPGKTVAVITSRSRTPRAFRSPSRASRRRAAPKRNAEGLEIAGRHRVEEREGRLGRGVRLARYRESAVRPSAGEKRGPVRAHGATPGTVANPSGSIRYACTLRAVSYGTAGRARNVITWSLCRPRSTRRRLSRERTNSPAPSRSTAERPTCSPTNSLRIRRCVRPPAIDAGLFAQGGRGTDLRVLPRRQQAEQDRRCRRHGDREGDHPQIGSGRQRELHIRRLESSAITAA